MLKKNVSSDDIFYYIPKITASTRNEKSLNGIREKAENIEKKSIFFGLTGSSTFDYLNDINKNRYKFPKLKESFLTIKLRNKKILKDIEKKNQLENQTINPLHKLRLSNSSELFNKLTKSLMIDKNSLKDVNNEEILFDNNNINLNINNCDNLNDDFRNVDNKFNTLSKFNNCFIKKSLSSDKKKYTSSIIQSDDNKNNYKNNVKGMSKYYINFLYNKIFPKIFVEHNIKYNVVDNKLNIFYAENDRQFKEKLVKRNNYLRLKGMPVKKMCINSVYVADKLRDVKRKIGFLKGITDYSFPSIILQKVKSKNKLYQLNRKKKDKFYLPYEDIEREANEFNMIKDKILAKTIQIENDKKNNKI
jgi:hypothetical protein